MSCRKQALLNNLNFKLNNKSDMELKRYIGGYKLTKTCTAISMAVPCTRYKGQGKVFSENVLFKVLALPCVHVAV